MKTKNKKRREPKSYLTNNLTLKLLSLFFAIILWSFTISRTDPQRTKRITEVPVTVSGLSALEEKGLTLRDGTDDLGSVTVKVSVAYSDFKRIDKNYISATVDLSKITSAGTVALTVMPSVNISGDVGTPTVNPSSITVTVDECVTKEVPVVLNTSNSLKEGLISVSPSYPQTVEIKGSSYYAEKISKAVLNVDLSALNDGDSVTSLCTFTDDKNNAVKFPQKTLTADMDVRTVKEVKISAEDAVINSDKLAVGYRLSSINAGKIKICAHKDILDTIEEIVPDSIDLTGLDSSTVSLPLSFTLPDGVDIVPNQETPKAQVKITESSADLTVKRNITVSGLEGSSASVTSGKITRRLTADGTISIEATVVLSGPAPLLNSITDSDVMVKLSLTGKSAGTYNLEPVVILSSSIASKVTAKLTSPVQVSVTVK